MKNPLLLRNWLGGPPQPLRRPRLLVLLVLLVLLALLPARRVQAQFGTAATSTSGNITLPKDVTTADFNGAGKPDALLPLGDNKFGPLATTTAPTASCAAPVGSSPSHVTHPL